MVLAHQKNWHPSQTVRHVEEVNRYLVAYTAKDLAEKYIGQHVRMYQASDDQFLSWLTTCVNSAKKNAELRFHPELDHFLRTAENFSLFDNHNRWYLVHELRCLRGIRQSKIALFWKEDKEEQASA